MNKISIPSLQIIVVIDGFDLHIFQFNIIDIAIFGRYFSIYINFPSSRFMVSHTVEII